MLQVDVIVGTADDHMKACESIDPIDRFRFTADEPFTLASGVTKSRGYSLMTSACLQLGARRDDDERPV